MLNLFLKRAFSTTLNPSFWKNVKPAGLDPTFGIFYQYLNDKDPRKVSLVLGTYMDKDGKPYVFKVVKKTEKEIMKDNLNKEYLPMSGDPTYCKAAQKVIFGKEMDNVATIQSLAGSGALYLGANFCSRYLPKDTKVYFSDPTWEPHFTIFKHAGLHNIDKYPYYDENTKLCNFEKMYDGIKNAKENSVILLHGAGHNPTGVDLSKSQWDSIAEILHKKNHLAFIDIAYQGFATGSLDDDRYCTEAFAKKDVQFIVAQSFSKNLGLYSERTGAMHVFCQSKEEADRILPQITIGARASYSNPPGHGQEIVKRIVNSEERTKEWKKELASVSQRMKDMRKMLFEKLVKLKTPGNWEHIIKQVGMFTYTGLNEGQYKILKEKYHVYILWSGRLAIPNLTAHNVDYVAQSIHDLIVTQH